VNILWIVAILGITVSVGPALYVVLKPLQQLLVNIAIWMFNNVILPLHRVGAFELLSYIACTVLLIEGARSPSERGIFISATGMALTVPAFAYSSLLHAKVKIPEDKLTAIVSLWIASVWIPSALHFQSSLMGWIAVVAFYSYLGFSVVCTGLCYYIGFEKNQIVRVAVTSVLLLTLFVSLKIGHVASWILIPFGTPIMVFGSLVLLLALLIISSAYNYSMREQSFVGRQLLICSVVIVELFFGSVYQIDSIRNTAITFLGLYLTEKWVELHDTLKWNPWVFFFLFFVVLWRVALYLHTNPQFIVSMFQAPIE